MALQWRRRNSGDIPQQGSIIVTIDETINSNLFEQGKNMRRVLATILSIGFIIISFTGCSGTNSSVDFAVNMDEDITESKEAKEIEETVEMETVNEDAEDAEESKKEIDKSAILATYDSVKANLGKYYCIWDSPKFEIPLLLITDYCVTGEDAEMLGFGSLGSAYDCKVYLANPDKELKVEEIGNLEAPSTSYPLAGSDDGLFTAFHHFVHQYIPDYEEGKLILWYGFEDDVVNEATEHDGFLKINDGKMEDLEVLDEGDEEKAYDIYRSAEVLSFKRTSGLTDPFEVYNFSKEYELEEEMFTCALNLVEDGKYHDFEGDIGDVFGEYKDIDIDGDGESDTIERILAENAGYAYLFSFSNGNTLQTHTFSALPNEGEIIELRDMDGDCRDEILVTHYTDSTGGPLAWDVYLYYCDNENKWNEITIKDEHIQIQDMADACGFTIGSDEEPNLVGVELTNDGIAMLVDYGAKIGPDQTFNLDVFLFDYEKGKLSLSKHSSELVSKYWPRNADGRY